MIVPPLLQDQDDIDATAINALKDKKQGPAAPPASAADAGTAWGPRRHPAATTP